MKKIIAILLLLILVVTNFATYKITKESIKPEKVIVKQEVEIIKYKIREQERMVIGTPKIGISKSFVRGTIFGIVLKAWVL